jgi:hypothetical protein
MDKSFRLTGIYNKMDSSVDFIINDIDNASESNDNDDDSCISSDSK